MKVKDLIEKLARIDDSEKEVYLRDWNEDYAKPNPRIGVEELDGGVYLGIVGER